MKKAALKLWSVPVDGFDDQTAVAQTRDKARYAVFVAGREAGYFKGRDGFQNFLTRVGFIQEIHWREVERRIGGYLPAGAPVGWSLNDHKAGETA